MAKKGQVKIRYGRHLLYLILGLLLLIDWAAIDDIMTGNETDLTLEWFVILISILIYAWVFINYKKISEK